MARSWILAASAVLAFASPAGAIKADSVPGDDIEAATFVSVGPMSLAPGNELDLECDMWLGWDGVSPLPERYPRAMAVAAHDIEGGGLMVMATEGTDGTAIRAGDFEATIVESSQSGWWSSAGIGVTAHSEPLEDVRLVVAAWGVATPCKATLNGSPIPYDVLPGSSAAYLTASAGPLAAEVGCWCRSPEGDHVRGGSRVGAGLTYARQTDAFMFMGVSPLTGVGRVTGPDDYLALPPAIPAIYMGETHGLWRYELFAGANASLVIMEMPV